MEGDESTPSSNRYWVRSRIICELIAPDNGLAISKATVRPPGANHNATNVTFSWIVRFPLNYDPSCSFDKASTYANVGGTHVICDTVITISWFGV